MSHRSPRLLALLTVVSLVWLSIPWPIRTQASSSDSFLPDEVILKLVRTSDLTAVAADFGLDPAPIDQFGLRSIYRLRIIDGISPRDKAAALMADPLARVTYSDPNLLQQAPEGAARTIYAGGGSDTEYVSQWAPALIRFPEAHAVTRGAGIVVAVLDTGVDFGHPALAGRLLPGFDFVDNDFDPSEGGTYTQNAEFGHGTHVAGLIALAAPEAQIMPLRVLDPDGVGNIWALAEALAYAMDPDGDPDTVDGADVINLSLSTIDRSKLIKDVLKAVTCNDGNQNQSPDDLPCFSPTLFGAVVVAAAGNRAGSIPEYPAGEGLAGTMAIGASTQADSLAVFSNFGSWVGAVAPGEGILSSVPGGGYGTWSGTSMATPLAAGEAALVRAAFPSLKPAKVVRRIVGTSLEIGGPVRYRIDAAAALGLGSAQR